MSGTLEVPADVAAEEVVAGCAVATEHGAALAHERLRLEMFYGWWAGQLFTASAQLVGIQDQEDRIDRAAAITGCPRDRVADLVDDRQVQFDSAGCSAHRVLVAYRRRQAMAALEAGYRMLGEGGTEEDVRRLLVEAGVAA